MPETFFPLPVKIDEDPERALNDNFMILFRILNDIRSWVTAAKMDWGTGTDQISGADMPLADAGSHYTTDDVESALQETANDRENMMALIYLGL